MMRNMVIPTMLKPIDKIKLILYTEFLEARYVLYPAFFDMIYDISLSTTINYDTRLPIKKDKCSA